MPPGVPTGGQFAPQERAEAEVDLAGGDPRRYDGDDVDSYAAKHGWTPRDWEKYVEERCAVDGCGNRLDDGEGYDGLCGDCADALERQDEHQRTNADCENLAHQVAGGLLSLDDAVQAYHDDHGHWLDEHECRTELSGRAAQLTTPGTWAVASRLPRTDHVDTETRTPTTTWIAVTDEHRVELASRHEKQTKQRRSKLRGRAVRSVDGGWAAAHSVRTSTFDDDWHSTMADLRTVRNAHRPVPRLAPPHRAPHPGGAYCSGSRGRCNIDLRDR